MKTSSDAWPVVDDELDLLDSLVGLRNQSIVELGCGAADLARRLVLRFPECRVSALEVDARQHAANLARPQAGIEFIAAGAESVPGGDAQFDLAMMLKSLHHVPMSHMDAALSEVRRVLRPGAWLYVSEPVFAGPLNEVIRLFHDEQVVRAAALDAIHRATRSGAWEAVTEYPFMVTVRYRDFADFERKVIQVTFLEHRLDAARREQVRRAFEEHMGSNGAEFTRPMRVNLLRKPAG